MPTYEYQCTKCGKTFDLFQSITAKPLRKHECPACGTMRSVRRLIGTGGGILFKGSGFYQTDYRSDHYQKAAKADKEPVSTTSSDSSKSTSSSDASTAAKPAAAKTPTPTAAAEKPAAKKKTPAKTGAA